MSKPFLLIILLFSSCSSKKDLIYTITEDICQHIIKGELAKAKNLPSVINDSPNLDYLIKVTEQLKLGYSIKVGKNGFSNTKFGGPGDIYLAEIKLVNKSITLNLCFEIVDGLPYLTNSGIHILTFGVPSASDEKILPSTSNGLSITPAPSENQHTPN